jgi:hypothetical protein
MGTLIITEWFHRKAIKKGPAGGRAFLVADQPGVTLGQQPAALHNGTMLLLLKRAP